LNIEEVLCELAEVVARIEELEGRRKDLASQVKSYVAALGEVRVEDLIAKIEPLPKANMKAEKRGSILRKLIDTFGADRVAECLDPYRIGRLLLELPDSIDGCSLFFVEVLKINRRRRCIHASKE